jgi:L,D-transpeptidase YcbB
MRGLLLMLALFVCLPFAPAAAIEPNAPERLISSEEAIGIRARRMLEERAGPAAKAEKSDLEALVSFYAGHENRPLWISDSKVNLRGKAVIEEISRADDWGLEASAFDLSETGAREDAGPEELARAEVALSLAVLKYANHARGGRILEPSKQLASYLDRKPQLIEPALILEQISRSDEADAYLRGLHPQHPQFAALRKALLKIRKPGAGKDGKEQVRLPASGPLLSEGRKHPDVVLLRKRLGVLPHSESEGETGDPELFDEAVAEAVKDFQRENGLYVDGVVGRNSRIALNGDTADVSEDMIIANMEEWRWMPDLGDFYVQANIPEFMLRVVHNGRVIHSERIIAGEVGKQTPIFSDEMETVVFHPFWGVPDSIKVNEILPSVARGGRVLERHNLRLQYRGRDIDPYSVDWSRADIRNFHVYQPPGQGNVLGEVKFVFPNKHQVYMHDTPTKYLFDKSERTFSHGCMRVRNPLKLAEAVLNYDKGWDMQRVESVVDNGPQNNNIDLQKKVPVHVTYFTAIADEDGNVTAYRDVYGHEKRIQLALAGRWNEIDKGRDHLAPVRLDRSRIVVNPYYNNPISDLFKQAFGF